MRNWILNDLCDDHLIESIERNTMEHLLFFPSRHPMMDVLMQEDFILVDTRIPSHFFNYIYTTRVLPDGLQERIRRTISYFQNRTIPFSWIIGPTISAESFEPFLQQAGLVCRECIYCMALHLQHLQRKLKYIPRFRVQQALTKRSITDVGKVYSTVQQEQEAVHTYFEKIATLAFHTSDPIKLFVGYFNEEPAVAGEMYLGAGIAGMHCHIAETFMPYEKEFVTDLVMKMLLQAEQQGYHWAVMHALKKDCEYFSQIGFKHYCEFCRYR